MNNYMAMMQRSFTEYPDRDCLVIDGVHYSYEEVARKISALHSSLKNCRIVCLSSEKSLETYLIILCCLMNGIAFSPVSLDQPIDRIVFILNQIKPDIFITKDGFDKEINICRVIKKSQIGNVELDVDSGLMNNDIAYVLFTSGSTGIPKGVLISRANLDSYAVNVLKDIKIKSTDRVSQFFDLTFDVAIHDIVTSIASGASLYVLGEKERLFPLRYIEKNKITVWFSVPSYMNAYVDQFGTDKQLESIRISIFAGEALSAAFLKKWAKIARSSQIYNLYGPTETTIGICWAEIFDHHIDQGEIPIGLPPGDHHYKIEAVPGEDAGELIVYGPQVSVGYTDELQNAGRYVMGPNNQRGYRTGDKVKMNDGLLYYVGRKDNQVKVKGFRIELEDVEEVLKKATGILDIYCCVAKTDKFNKVVVVTSSNEHRDKIKENIFSLPEYMIPDEIISISHIPRTQSGKIDRKALSNIFHSPC